MDEVFCLTAVDWTALVQPSSRIHILHGGKDDKFGVYQAVRHLQRTWGMGLVVCKTGEQLQELATTIPTRVSSSDVKLIVCVPIECVYERPDAYDEVCAYPNVTCILTAPISALDGKPYSRRSHIVALLLPSSRVDMDVMYNVDTIYSFPNTTDAGDLQSMMWVLPHGYGLAWSVGTSRMPAYVNFTNAVPASSSRSLQDTQNLVDRAWWWTRDTNLLPRLQSLPLHPVMIVTVKNAPFCPSMQPALTRVEDSKLRFVSAQSEESLLKLRASPDVSTRQWDAHVIDATDAITPIFLCLDTTVHTKTYNPDTEAYDMVLTCPCTFACATSVEPVTASTTTTSKWKAYAGFM